MTFIHRFALCVFSVLLCSSCVSTHVYEGSPEARRVCIPTDRVRSFEVLGPTTVRIDAGRVDYVVTVRPGCRFSPNPDAISFSEGPTRLWKDEVTNRWYHADARFSNRICGRSMDRLVIRDRWNDAPPEECPIVSINEIDPVLD